MRRKTLFYELILECPYIHPLKTCPFNVYRKMSITELIDTTRNFKSSDYKLMINQHKECYKKRKLEEAKSKKVHIKTQAEGY